MVQKAAAKAKEKRVKVKAVYISTVLDVPYFQERAKEKAKLERRSASAANKAAHQRVVDSLKENIVPVSDSPEFPAFANKVIAAAAKGEVDQKELCKLVGMSTSSFGEHVQRAKKNQNRGVYAGPKAGRRAVFTPDAVKQLASIILSRQGTRNGSTPESTRKTMDESLLQKAGPPTSQKFLALSAG